MSRDEMMLATMSAAGEGATFLPVQIQKLFFLIDTEATHLVDGPHFTFEPYDYGPFDSAVYEELNALKLRAVVEVDANGRYRKYYLTPTGFLKGAQILSSLPTVTQEYLSKVSRWVVGLNFQELVAAIYKKYPEMKVNSVFKQ